MAYTFGGAKPYGGFRVGAGRKSTWQRPTKMMRLPAEFEDQLVEFARKLDTGEVESISFNDFQLAVVAVLVSMPPLRRREASRLFKKLRRQLFSESSDR